MICESVVDNVGAQGNKNRKESRTGPQVECHPGLLEREYKALGYAKEENDWDLYSLSRSDSYWSFGSMWSINGPIDGETRLIANIECMVCNSVVNQGRPG